MGLPAQRLFLLGENPEGDKGRRFGGPRAHPERPPVAGTSSGTARRLRAAPAGGRPDHRYPVQNAHRERRCVGQAACRTDVVDRRPVLGVRTRYRRTLLVQQFPAPQVRPLRRQPPAPLD